jgi:hypothetical protein
MIPKGEQQQQQQQQQAALLALGSSQSDPALDSMLPSLLDVLLQHNKVEEFVEQVCTATATTAIAVRQCLLLRINLNQRDGACTIAVSPLYAMLSVKHQRSHL